MYEVCCQWEADSDETHMELIQHFMILRKERPETKEDDTLKAVPELDGQLNICGTNIQIGSDWILLPNLTPKDYRHRHVVTFGTTLKYGDKYLIQAVLISDTWRKVKEKQTKDTT